jgi:hypothetical protein
MLLGNFGYLSVLPATARILAVLPSGSTGLRSSTYFPHYPPLT